MTKLTLTITLTALLCSSCSHYKPHSGAANNKSVDIQDSCIGVLKDDITKNWHTLVNKKILNPSMSNYQKNDAFYERVGNIYKDCIKNNLAKNDVVTLFGDYTFDKVEQVNTYLYYQCIDTLTISNTLCLIFKINNTNGSVDSSLYTTCAYPQVRID